MMCLCKTVQQSHNTGRVINNHAIGPSENNGRITCLPAFCKSVSDRFRRTIVEICLRAKRATLPISPIRSIVGHYMEIKITVLMWRAIHIGADQRDALHPRVLLYLLANPLYLL